MNCESRVSRRRLIGAAGATVTASLLVPSQLAAGMSSREREWRALLAVCSADNPSRSVEDYVALDRFERSILSAHLDSIADLRLAVAIARRAIELDDYRARWAPREVILGAAAFFDHEGAHR